MRPVWIMWVCVELCNKHGLMSTLPGNTHAMCRSLHGDLQCFRLSDTQSGLGFKAPTTYMQRFLTGVAVDLCSDSTV